MSEIGTTNLIATMDKEPELPQLMDCLNCDGRCKSGVPVILLLLLDVRLISQELQKYMKYCMRPSCNSNTNFQCARFCVWEEIKHLFHKFMWLYFSELP